MIVRAASRAANERVEVVATCETRSLRGKFTRVGILGTQTRFHMGLRACEAHNKALCIDVTRQDSSYHSYSTVEMTQRQASLALRVPSHHCTLTGIRNGAEGDSKATMEIATEDQTINRCLLPASGVTTHFCASRFPSPTYRAECVTKSCHLTTLA